MIILIPFNLTGSSYKFNSKCPSLYRNGVILECFIFFFGSRFYIPLEIVSFTQRPYLKSITFKIPKDIKNIFNLANQLLILFLSITTFYV